MKLFYCGICKGEKRKAMIRPYLRNHLKEKHGIKSNLTNFISGKTKQRWWITKEI